MPFCNLFAGKTTPSAPAAETDISKLDTIKPQRQREDRYIQIGYKQQPNPSGAPALVATVAIGRRRYEAKLAS